MFLGLMLLGNLCGDPPPPPDEGAFLLGVRVVLPEEPNPVLAGGQKETLEGLEGLEVKVSRVEAVVRSDADDPATEQIYVLDQPEMSMTLIGDLQNLAPQQIAFLNIPSGHMTQLRLITSEAKIFIRGETFPVEIPSGENTGLKVVPIDGVPFEIRPQDRTGARIVLNPFTQLIRNKGQGFKLKPVLEAEHVYFQDLSPIIMDHVIVKFREHISPSIPDILALILNVEKVKFDPISKYYLFKLPINLTYIDAILEFEKYPEYVEYASPDTLVGLALEPCGWIEPPEPGRGFYSSSQIKASIFSSFRALEAWDTTLGSRNIVIAVVDNGFRPSIRNETLNSYNYYINQEELRGKFEFATKEDLWNEHDIDGDRRITFIDLNNSANFDLCGESDGLSSSCDYNKNGIVDVYDLVSGDAYHGGLCRKKDSNKGFIGFENGIDEDENGFCDDLLGWDIAESDNNPYLTVEEIEETESPHGDLPMHIIAEVGTFPTEENSCLSAPHNYGVAPNISVMPVRLVLTESSDPYKSTLRSEVILGISYAVNQHADVINISAATIYTRSNKTISCGRKEQTVVQHPNGKNGELFNAFRERVLNGDGNGLNLDQSILVTAAGNCSINTDEDDVINWPGEINHPNIVNVGGSSFALAVNDRTPDVLILNEGPNSVDIAASYSAIIGFTEERGTSASAPYVTGALALMLAADSSLRNNPSIAIQRLYCNANPIDSYSDPSSPVSVLHRFGHGLLDIAAAVKNEKNCP